MSLYLDNRCMMRALDVIAFAGPNSDPISALIKAAARKYTHVAIVRQPWIPPDDVKVFHCTRDKIVDGCTTTPLGEVLAGYKPGSRADLYRLKASAQIRVEDGKGLFDFYAMCGAQQDHVRYDIGALFRFLLPDIIVQRWEPHVLTAEVCSVCVSACLEAAHATIGVTPWRMTPLDVISLPIFEAPVRIL